MKDKKGFIKILEAFVAILIITGVMVFVYVNQIQKPSLDDSINQLLRLILEDIANKPSLRQAVLSADNSTINNSIRGFIPSEYQYDFKICDLNKLCKTDAIIKKEIYSREITISSTLQDYNPKVLKIFIWEK